MHQDWQPGELRGHAPQDPFAPGHDTREFAAIPRREAPYDARREAPYDPRYQVPVKRHDGRARNEDRKPRRFLKKRWFLIPAAGVGAVLLAGVAMASTGVGPIKFTVTSPVTVQALGVSASDTPVGQTVTAGAKVVAERDSVLAEVAIAVTGPDGKRIDFPHATDWRLGTSQKVFSGSRAFDQAGTYTYWFTYKKNNRWINVNPKQSFTVGGGSTPTTDPSTSPGATPSPTGSTPAPTATPTTPRPTTSTTAPPANPSLTGCAANPASCGYPSAATTGPRAGVALTTVNGDVTLSTAGAVYEGKDVKGCIRVTAPNVTIRNVKAACADVYVIDYSGQGGGTLTIQDTTVVCTQVRGTGIGERNLNVARVNVSGCENGFDLDQQATITDSYCHDLTSEKAVPEAHTDCVQGIMTNDITISHNTFISPFYATSAIEGDCATCSGITRVRWVVTNNLLDGGGYPLYCATRSAESGSIVQNNRFGSDGWNTGSYATGCTDTSWSGNFRDTTGAALSAA